MQRYPLSAAAMARATPVFPARLELPRPLGRLDHREADPVLHRGAGVGVLRLPVDRRPHPAADAAEADEGGPPDGVEDGVVGLEMLRLHHGVTPAGWGCLKTIGWVKLIATGRPSRLPGAKTSLGAAATAANRTPDTPTTRRP